MLFGKMNPALRGLLIVVLAVVGLAAVFFIIGLIDNALDNFNPGWIVKVLIAIAFLTGCYYLEKDANDTSDE